MDSNDVYYKDRIHAPLADRIEMPDYEEPVDALSDSSEEYALVHDALPAGKIQRVQSTLKREFKPGTRCCPTVYRPTQRDLVLAVVEAATKLYIICLQFCQSLIRASYPAKIVCLPLIYCV